MTLRKPQKEDPSKEAEGRLSKGTETSESKLFAMGSSLATRMSADRKFQCTEFDEKGSVVTGHGNIQRSELVSKVSSFLHSSLLAIHFHNQSTESPQGR